MSQKRDMGHPALWWCGLWESNPTSDVKLSDMGHPVLVGVWVLVIRDRWMEPLAVDILVLTVDILWG
jgi:hypothetical protein